jgi:hypothetical protein
MVVTARAILPSDGNIIHLPVRDSFFEPTMMERLPYWTALLPQGVFPPFSNLIMLCYDEDGVEWKP